ncbi:glycerol-3-phosphate responsive antiterminator [Thermatribacter velox]|jgi:glycerol uptake operon antiterminator|uniref:Glycerol-3-phosphate responsive antiterminator n=1 Tax=Thermatribacter velox TaxID=3039681 RepID=A0ABZ2YD23_9BACT
MSSFLESLKRKPVIGALRPSNLDLMINQKVSLDLCSVFFLLEGDIQNLETISLLFEEYRPFLFVHMDLFGGIASDESGLCFLKEKFPAVSGVITTRLRTLTLARKAGFLTIFRLFLIDSESLRTALRVVREVSPDALEILPGIIFPHLKGILPLEELPPLICGGFIRKKSDVVKILRGGAQGVSTSYQKMWLLNKELGCSG